MIIIENSTINQKINHAAKWATLTEIASKLITPFTNMVLARILAPDAFGVVATVTMIISFTDMFTDAGFQKYLVQQDFSDTQEKHKYANVAFWTNLCISALLWLIIFLFRDYIAVLVGNPGLGSVISIGCIQLIFTSFSSIQMSLYRRDFDFKTLFLVRIITVFVPVLVTIPLALAGMSYWSLIIGSLISQALTAILTTIKSNWKPKLYYNFFILKRMISFSIWSLIEAISIWFTTWIDAFIIGKYLSEYHLGLYKTSTSLVNSLLAIVTASVIPVLFAALSRLKNDDLAFQQMFFSFQKLVAYIVLPIGVGVMLYSDIATSIFLGNQWTEAAPILAIWVLTSVIVIVYSNFNSEVYRAKGKPKISFISQMLHLLFLVPTCLISINIGFWPFIYARSLIRLQGVIVGLIIMGTIMGFKVRHILKNTFNPCIATGLMFILAISLQQISTIWVWKMISIFILIIFYIFIVIKLEGVSYFKELINLKKK